ncbi:hypothetical protein JCM11251_007106 [Rhodosporidiobolus azoricus]
MRSTAINSACAAVLLGASFAAAKPVSVASSLPPSLEVTIKNGTIKGIALPTFEQHAFLGIPYSEPPKRFEHSVPRSTPFSGTFNAANYSSICYGLGNAGTTPFNQSEDCLSINIVRPDTTTADDKLPIVLWIHGGGAYAGSSALDSYNGSYIVEQSVEMGMPIIFTSINYRLLVGGFPSGHEAHSLGIENLGLLDQRLAMHWLQENIAAFGGDPDKVTVMGESAGGSSILQHLVAYGGRKQDLFRAAIVESGSFYQSYCNWNLTEWREANWQSLLAATNCTNLACLKELDADSLYTTAGTFYDKFLYSIDGDFMQEHPVQLLDEKKFVDVALLMGVNADEGTILSTKGCDNDTAVIAGLTSLNQSSYVVLPDQFDALLAAYPDDPAQGIPLNTGDGVLSSGVQDKRVNSLFNDAIEHSPRRWITSMMSERNAVYSYHFQQVPYGNTIDIGSTHGVEVPYVFSNPATLGPRESDADLARLVTRSWISFIHSLSPIHTQLEDVPNWPRYKNRHPVNMVFKASGSYIEEDDYRSEGIELWTQQRIVGCKDLAPKHQLA